MEKCQPILPISQRWWFLEIHVRFQSKSITSYIYSSSNFLVNYHVHKYIQIQISQFMNIYWCLLTYCVSKLLIWSKEKRSQSYKMARHIVTSADHIQVLNVIESSAEVPSCDQWLLQVMFMINMDLFLTFDYVWLYVLYICICEYIILESCSGRKLFRS